MRICAGLPAVRRSIRGTFVMIQTGCFKDFLRYAFLNVLGMIGLSCYILADTFFISRGMGADGLTALNLAIPVFSLISGCGQMFAMGGAIKYTILNSQGNSKDANLVFTNTLWLSVLFSLIFVLSGILIPEKIAHLLGADSTVFTMTKTYLQVLLVFSPFFMLNYLFQNFVRNDKAPKLAMIAMLSGSLANIALDYVFIFPLHLGILGAVLATCCAPIISMLILYTHKRRRKNGFHLVKIGLHGWIIKTVFSLGFPSLITEISSGIVILVFNRILIPMTGNIGVAAYGVIANLSLVVLSIYTGIAQGMQPLVSQAYGTGNSDRLKRTLHYALTSVVLLSALLYTIIFVWAAPITAIFNEEGNRQLAAIAVPGLRIYFSGAAFAGINIVFTLFFAASEQARASQTVTLLRGLILIIPSAFLLAAVFGTNGVWLSFPVTEFIVSVLGSILYFVGKKVSIDAAF